MKPCLVVLTDFSPAAERARAYAAVLAAALEAELHLVHVFAPPVLNVEYGMVMPPVMDAGYVQETRQALRQMAATLPAPATAEVIEADWYGAVEQALSHYHPLLLVAGLTTTAGWLDEWLSNRALPLTRQMGYPLLLIPEKLPDAALRVPQRLVLAVQDQGFTLAPSAQTIASLLDTLQADVVPVTVLSYEQRAGGEHGLRAAQACGLASTAPDSILHKVSGTRPAEGIRQAVSELTADGLILLDQGHGWVHALFSGSVIDQVLRQTQVPVLLLAAHPTAEG